MTESKIEEMPESSGKRHLLAMMAGKKLTRSQAMLAKCCDCMGGYVDGRNDCQIHGCPMYPWMPYRQNRGSKAKPE
jgi:hypothetical protein